MKVEYPIPYNNNLTGHSNPPPPPEKIKEYKVYSHLSNGLPEFHVIKANFYELNVDSFMFFREKNIKEIELIASFPASKSIVIMQ